MLNPIEKFKVAILHLNRAQNHCYSILVMGPQKTHTKRHLDLFQHNADYVVMLHICLTFRIYTLNSSSQYSKFEGAFTGVPDAK